jgi:hypothetical protein
MVDTAAGDVLEVAWHAAGQPDPGVALDSSGTCVRCLRASVGAALDAVVSGKYGDWDRLPGRAAPGPLVWCAPCAWGHRHLPLRTRPHLIGPGQCTPLTAAGLAAVLAAPVDAATAVIVPLSRHKHLAPFATWGAVTTDDATLRWTRQDTRLLVVVARLRTVGVPAAALRHPDPPIDALARLPVADRTEALCRWRELDPWRRRLPWLDVAVRATRPGAASRQGAAA